MVNLECMPLAANNVYFTDSFLQLPGKKANIGLLTLFVATWNDYAGICKPLKEIYIVK